MPASIKALITRVVGVALLAFVCEHALACETRRLIGEAAIGINGIGNVRIDAARSSEFQRVRGPNVEVFAAMAWRGVHKAGAGIVSDVIAGKQWNLKVVIATKTFQRMRTGNAFQRVSSDTRI